MTASVFDQAAREYEAIHNRALPPGVQSADFIQQRAARVSQWILERHCGHEFACLDFGCGNGRMLKGLLESESLKSLLASDQLRLYGFDTSKESLREARILLGDDRVELAANWGHFPQGLRFDLVVGCHVFHHIPPTRRSAAVETLHGRMTSHSRLVIWEHNPFNPVTRWLVKMCPFDSDARLLTPASLQSLFARHAFRPVQSAYVNLLPPQWLKSPRWSALEAGLSGFPIGAQYWVMFNREDRPRIRSEKLHN